MRTAARDLFATAKFLFYIIIIIIIIIIYQTLWTFLTGVKIAISDPIVMAWMTTGPSTCRQHFDGGVIYSTKWRRLLIAADGWRSATHQWILFMTKSLDVGPTTSEENLIVWTGKSEAKVTSNKRLRWRYCTTEANYRQTQSIARPLCDSSAYSMLCTISHISTILCKSSNIM